MLFSGQNSIVTVVDGGLVAGLTEDLSGAIIVDIRSYRICKSPRCADFERQKAKTRHSQLIESVSIS